MTPDLERDVTSKLSSEHKYSVKEVVRENRRLVAGDERKKRIADLEKYVENNYGSGNPTPPN